MCACAIWSAVTSAARHRFPSSTFKAASRGIPLAAALQKPAALGRDASPRRPRTVRGTVPAVSYRAAFTVLELVIVIGVLSILLAVVLPTIKTVHAAALRKKAQVGATALAQAAIRYKTEYGFWPGQLEAGNTEDTVKLRDVFKNAAQISGIISRFNNDDFNSSGNASYITITDNEVYQAFRRVGEKSGGTFKPNPLNPKGIHFLDLENEDDRQNVRFPDPWDKPTDRRGYILIMGLDPHKVFPYETKTSSGTVISRHFVSNHIAFAFSRGSPADHGTNYIYSAGVR